MSGFWSEKQPAAVWTVADLNRYIRDLIEIDYRLKNISVAGEISNYTRARSGHLYFTLKDEKSQLKCVMWRSDAERLVFNPGDGDAVVAHGRIAVYETNGVYQLYAEDMEPAGRGDLAVAFEQLRQRLAEEGLFDPAHKQPIPTFPGKIGIVTSIDAAALRDILNVLRRRFPLVSVLIAPTLVQGQEAPRQIIRALQWLDGRDDIDTIIIARGGGSIEDLWAFNDEQVARAVFAARHPVICGVGHETDFTIVDFVADLRAPTPSAAAEQAVPDIQEMAMILTGLQQRLLTEMVESVEQRQWRLKTRQQSLQHLSPRQLVDNLRQRLDTLTIRLDTAIHASLERSNNRLQTVQAAMQAMSPLATLARGYAIVRLEDGQIVRSIANVTSGAMVAIQLTDGVVRATVTDIHDDLQSQGFSGVKK